MYLSTRESLAVIARIGALAGVAGLLLSAVAYFIGSAS